MFKAIGVSLLKILIAIVLLALAFWPNGAGTYVVKNFDQMPVLYSIVIALWAGAMALNLPLSLQKFRLFSTLSLIVIFAAVMYKLWSAGKFDLGDGDSWQITGIFFFGITVGWITVSSKLWRWYRKVLPIDDPDTGEDE